MFAPKLVLLASLNCLLASFSLHSQAEPPPSGEITYYIVEDLASPFQIASEGVSNGGLITDLVEIIFRDTPLRVIPKPLPVNRLHRIIREDTQSVWLTYDAKVWNSLADVGDFVDEPLFTVNHALLTCHSQPRLIDTETDLLGMTLAILDNFSYPELRLLEERGALTLTSVEKYEQGFRLAAAGRVDGFVEMEIRLRYNLAQENEASSDCYHFLNMDAVIPPYDIYLSMSKQASPDLREMVTQKIRQLKGSEDYKQVFARYMGRVTAEETKRAKAAPAALCPPACATVANQPL
ncbi:transporter substrate-binding domain-containing protein [Hahella aquimaris]|uniref:substrate-binding periplasmic protein n=1 Tax=Hahella sp. HNIBRBA332 TaxID=3015983 RepID=UPI00273B53EC|nr:transporter substrate-binding domain-containing protein [Hahella sp. HNIBRBA332]WLQ15909.1 transporter substrate-binding domain-containing protein [Hahella sp. HNIBRBA332]